MPPPVSTPAAQVAPTRAPGPQRDLLIDVVRGIAIMLVALGHTDIGIIGRGWWGSSNAGYRIAYAIYAFHMPAFFFVSGVFLRPGVEKRGEKHYTLEKLRTMIYPYVLWAFIFAGATIPFARYMLQKTPNWKTFFFNLVTGNTSWFLPTLFFALMIGMLTRRFPLPLLFVLSVLAAVYVPHMNAQFAERGIRNLPFLVTGMWVGGSFKLMQRVPWLLSAVLAAAFAVIILVWTKDPYSDRSFLAVALGMMGTLMLMLLARCLGKSMCARALAWTGAASFGIFLLSSFPQGAGREILVRVFHTTAPWPQLMFPTALAVIIPAWLYHRRIRLHIGWLFVWPF